MEGKFALRHKSSDKETLNIGARHRSSEKETIHLSSANRSSDKDNNFRKSSEEKATVKLNKPTYSTPMPKKESMYSKRTRLSFSTSDRATKRVIAPYVRIVRRGQKVTKVEKEEESKQFRFYLQKKPSVLMRNLSAFLSDSVDLASILHETAEVLKGVTKAIGVTLYMADVAAGEIYQSPRNVISSRHKVNWKIEPGKTIAAYVAYHREYVMIDDVLGDARFPDGIGYKDETIKSVLCVPIVTPDDECYGIIELCRDVTQPVFARDDLKIVVVVTGWVGAAIHQNQQRIALQKQQELNDYLLDLTKCYFADTVVMEKMISEVVSFAKVTLGAERGSFYIIDKDSEELMADAFEEGIDSCGEDKLHKKNLQVQFSKENGIPGLVARSGETVNIMDAYTDPRFNKEADGKSLFITRSILCMPIMGVNGILGVVQVVNKKSGLCFTKGDENLLKTFTLYCALSLHYSRLSSILSNTEKINKSYLNLLKYHIRPCQHDMNTFLEQPEVPVRLEGFNEFSWYVTPDLHLMMPQLTLGMITDVVGEADINLVPAMEFILTVQKSYRDNPYHNFEHAFNVCHCMYNMVSRNLDSFSSIELKALMIASLCHDLDHPGFTNNFLQLTNDTLYQLYDESFLENHHFLVTMTIIGECEMFHSMSPNTFKEMSKEIKKLILATDLPSYFKCRTKLIQLWNDNLFDWNNVNHRALLKALMMTTADLSGQCKPYNIAKKITDSLYKEFYNQGDIEKSMGLCPLSMMDREKQHMVPEDQVQFLSVVVIPCTELVQIALPNTDELLTEAQTLRDTWRQIIDLRGQKCWRQDDSVTEEDDRNK